MAATFGTLNLEDLGVVGEPDVQYANFETEVSQPKGYDGGVLANFRRGATTIKFNLALTGTKSEITNKLNALAAELNKGQQELILPTMTPGYHFDASANCALQPAQYIDGFVLPLEFVVPHGLAVSETHVQAFEYESVEQGRYYYADIIVNGQHAVPYIIEGNLSDHTFNIDDQYKTYIDFDGINVSVDPADQPTEGHDVYVPAGLFVLDSDEMTATQGGYSFAATFYGDTKLQPGTTRIGFAEWRTMLYPPGALSVKWKDTSVW